MIPIPFLALALSQPVAPPTQPGALFDTTKFQSVSLRFTREQWDAMTPKGNFQGFGGPPPSGFGAGSMLAPIFVRAGDRDYDGALSRTEFVALGERWFGLWDASKSGNVGLSQLQSGMNTTLKPPPMNLVGAEGKRNGVAGMMGIEFEFVRASLDVNGQSFPEVAVRYKGNGTYLGSMRSLKRPLKVDIDKHDPKATLAGVSTLNLHNSVSDASWMNDTLAHRFFRDAGVPSPRTGYAKVRLTVQGVHDNRLLGLYEMVEDVDFRFTKQRFGVDGGALFKPSTPELFAYRGDNWKRYQQMYDPKGKPTEAQTRRVIDLCKLVTLGSDSEFAKQIGGFIDLTALAHYMAALVCVTDLDGILGPGQNLYLFLHPKTGQFHFIPWDYDQSFGQFGMRGTQEQREQLSIAKPWQGENRFLERIFRLPQFQTAYRAKLRTLSATLFTPQRIGAQVDQLAKLLRPAVAEESKELLARFDASVAGKGLPPNGPWGAAIKPVKAFLPIRAGSIRDQLAGKSKGLTLGEFMGFGPPGANGGLGNLLAPAVLRAMDTNQDQKVSRPEIQAGFAAWFARWDPASSGVLSEDALRNGLNAAVPMGPPGGPGGFGGPPPGAGDAPLDGPRPGPPPGRPGGRGFGFPGGPHSGRPGGGG